MKKSEFSEKIFEILIDHALLSKGLGIYVPSQNKESLLGYDALFQKGKIKVGFYQYKIVSKYVKKPSCHKKAKRVFKFDLHYSKHNGYRQHNLLVNRNLSGLNCGYLVPSFIEYDTLYKNHHLGELDKFPNIILIKPTKYIIDNKYHYITFDDTGSAIQHSKDETSIETKSIDFLSNAIKESNLSYSKDVLTDEILNFFDENNNDNNEEKEEKAIRLLYESGICLVTYICDNPKWLEWHIIMIGEWKL